LLTKYDDLMCHQASTTFDHVVSSDRNWVERMWFGAHDKAGKHYLTLGMGLYPNRNVMDAYASMTVDNTQHMVRASRELRPAYDKVAVGPFSYEIIEGMREVRYALSDNEHALSCDIRFEATMEPYEETHQFTRARGRAKEDVARFLQVGKPSGWIKLRGRTYEVTREGWVAERDHSWGIRWGAGGGAEGGGLGETGVQPDELAPGVLYTLAIVGFKDWGFGYHVREDPEGRPWFFSGAIFYPRGSGKQELRLASIDHKFEFYPEIRMPESGRVVLHGADGSERTVSIRGQVPYYLGPNGYFYYKGFSCGLWKGPSYTDGHQVNLNDPEVRKTLHILNEQSAEVRCGDDIGYGTIEMLSYGNYAKYGWGEFKAPYYDIDKRAA
jgi:hypothetical protein